MTTMDLIDGKRHIRARLHRVGGRADSFTSSRGTEVEQSREVARRLTRPADEVEESTSCASSGRRRAVAVRRALYNMNLLRKLERVMWQAGMYMRVGDMLLIIVLLFSAPALVRRHLFFHDMWFAMLAAV